MKYLFTMLMMLASPLWAQEALIVNDQEYELSAWGPSGQDMEGTVTVSENNTKLSLVGNRWQSIPFNYEVTPDTHLEFDFSSSAQGEIHAIGFDVNNVLDNEDTNRFFRVYGTQGWGVDPEEPYVPTDTQHYFIPVGKAVTGQFDRLVFAMDDDANTAGESVFSNVKVYEHIPYMFKAELNTEKAINHPTDKVNMTLKVTSSHLQSNVLVKVDVLSEVDNDSMVYHSMMDIPAGETEVLISWNTPDNVWGHLATAILTDEEGSELAKDTVQFDVVDKWWKVMRLAASSGIVLANAGPPDSPGMWRSDGSIANTAKWMRKLGYNTTEMFHYADPYNMNMDGLEVWPYMDRLKDHLISRDRLIQWGKELKKQGMGYLAYNEMASITGPDEWKLYMKYSQDTFWCAYYCDVEKEGKEYFTPNGLFIDQLYADDLLLAVDNFGFTGVFEDSGTNIGRVAIEQSVDHNKERIEGTIGGFLADFHAPATKAALEKNYEFAFVHSNIWPMTSRARLRPTPNPPLDEVYDRLKDYADTQNMYALAEKVQLFSIEWDSANTPRDVYPQTYQDMTTYMAGAADILDTVVLQWAFLSGKNSTVAYVRPKMAMYLAAGMTINDHHNMYEGPLRGAKWREYPANKVITQYMHFWARYMYYTTNPERKLVRDPSFAVSGELYWKDAVRLMMVGDKKEYVINFLNLPADDKIQGQTEIPPVVEDGVLHIPADLGYYEAWALNADNPNLDPVKLVTEITSAGQRVEIPPVVTWMVLVLKEVEVATPPVEVNEDLEFIKSLNEAIDAHLAIDATIEGE